jgi:hypothetical protein
LAVWLIVCRARQPDQGQTLQYFANLGAGKIALWCYLIWYLGVVILYFDPSVALWLNAVGISAVVGIALILSVNGPATTDRWQTFRLFAMPFCVSSYAALIKGHGFVLIFPSDLAQVAALSGGCIAFAAVALALKRITKDTALADSHAREVLRGGEFRR